MESTSKLQHLINILIYFRVSRVMLLFFIKCGDHGKISSEMVILKIILLQIGTMQAMRTQHGNNAPQRCLHVTILKIKKPKLTLLSPGMYYINIKIHWCIDVKTINKKHTHTRTHAHKKYQFYKSKI